MLARDAMTADPVYIQETKSLLEAEHLFREYDMRHLPVLDSDGTLLDPVSAAMQADPIFVRPDSDIREVIDRMVQWRVGAVPVLEQGAESLVGIVSYVDVLRSAREWLN